jgi:hypothetical protein
VAVIGGDSVASQDGWQPLQFILIGRNLG